MHCTIVVVRTLCHLRLSDVFLLQGRRMQLPRWLLAYEMCQSRYCNYDFCYCYEIVKNLFYDSTAVCGSLPIIGMYLGLILVLSLVI